MRSGLDLDVRDLVIAQDADAAIHVSRFLGNGTTRTAQPCECVIHCVARDGVLCSKALSRSSTNNHISDETT